MPLPTEYFPYRRQCELNYLGHKAVLAYYNSNPHLFTPTIDGEERTYAVLAPEQWRDAAPDFTTGTDRQFISHSESTLQNYVKLLAHVNDDDPSEVDIEDYVWNGKLEAVSMDPDRDDVSIIESDYFSKLSEEQALIDDLLFPLYQKEVPPDADFNEIRHAVRESEFPLRDGLGTSLEHVLSSRPLFTGAALIVAFNTGDDTKIAFGHRSESNIENPGGWTPVPGGVFSTGNIRNDGLLDHQLTEFGEELFNIPEDGNALDSEPVREIRSRLDDGRASYEFLGTSVELRRLAIDYHSLLYIDDPEYYNDILAEQMEKNHEHSELELVSTTDTHRLKELTRVGQFGLYYMFPVVAGLAYLDQQDDVEVALDIDL